MYSFIKGQVAYVEEQTLAVDVHGVGYEIVVTSRTLDGMQAGQQVLLYTTLMVRENECLLYGFEQKREKAMFERLISVSGVGPKAAMAVLSAMTQQEIAQALMTADTRAFSKVSGIGPKTAGRIVLELKDKVDIKDAAVQEGVSVGLSSNTPQNEAVDALLSLGYSKAEAMQAVAAVGGLADSAEDITLLALKRLAM